MSSRISSSDRCVPQRGEQRVGHPAVVVDEAVGVGEDGPLDVGEPVAAAQWRDGGDLLLGDAEAAAATCSAGRTRTGCRRPSRPASGRARAAPGRACARRSVEAEALHGVLEHVGRRGRTPVHQSPGVPVAVPGSATGSRSPKSRSYISWTMGASASAFVTWWRRGIAQTVSVSPTRTGVDVHVVGPERRGPRPRTRAGCRRGRGSRSTGRRRRGGSPRRSRTRCRRGSPPRCSRRPASRSLPTYSSIFSDGTSKATWFIEPWALVRSPRSGRTWGPDTPGVACSAFGNQKNASASPPPQSKKKCWPPPGISMVLIERHAEHALVEVHRARHVLAHEGEVVDAAELEGASHAGDCVQVAATMSTVAEILGHLVHNLDASASHRRPAGGCPGHRARQLHRRSLRRAAARRLRSRRHQGRAARRRRSDAQLGRHHRRRRQPLVAHHRPQQALGRRRPAGRGGAGLRARPASTRPTSSSRTSGRDAWRSGASTTSRWPRRTRASSSCTSRASGRPGPAPPRPGSAPSARRWAASGTRPATPTGRRPAAASASATPSPPCSPSSARSPRCTSARPAAGARRSTSPSTRPSPR